MAKGKTIGEATREALIRANALMVKKYFLRAVELKLSRSEVMIVCIDGDDPTWTEMVDVLMPGSSDTHTAYRELGARPMVTGLVHREGLVEILKVVTPELSNELDKMPIVGTYHVLMFAAGGVSMYWLGVEGFGISKPAQA